MIAAGVKVVWVVHPYSRIIHVYRADGSLGHFRHGDTLTEPKLLPNFAFPVAELCRRVLPTWRLRRLPPPVPSCRSSASPACACCAGSAT